MSSEPRPFIPGPPPDQVIGEPDLVELDLDLSDAPAIEQAAMALGRDILVRDGVAHAIVRQDLPGLRERKVAVIEAKARALPFPKREPKPVEPVPSELPHGPIFPREDADV